MQLRINDITKACGGTVLFGDIDNAVCITGITTDSRAVTPGDLFIPLTGPHFDGHAYMAKAAAGGAVCALTERDTPIESMSIPMIRVKSTYRALMDLAAYYRRLFAVKVVAVTGSTGKTSTKDLLASVLSQRYRTRKTEGNRNNAVGLPLTLFGLTPEDEVIVLEMGMNHFGEIHELSLVARPDIAVITNIGDAHIENLGSREGILKAKLEILDGLAQDGVVFVYALDPLLAELTTEPFIPVGRPDMGANVYATDSLSGGLRGTRCLLHMGHKTSEVTIPQPGAHMVTNALFAAAIGERLGLTPAEIKRGIEGYIPTHARMEIVRNNALTLLDDSYNANPTSMRAAIDVLVDAVKTTQTRSVCILGDMLELGHHAEELHRELGTYIAQRGVGLLIAIGTRAAAIYNGYQEADNGEALYFADKAAFLVAWRSIIREDDMVLVKASHSMAFEEIVAALSAPGGQR